MSAHVSEGTRQLGPGSDPGSSTDVTELLRKVGLKVTRTRVAMLNLLASSREHKTADEIVAGLRQQRVPVDRVTIYRNLERMLDVGLLATIYLPGKAMRVGLCTRLDSPHHHMIVCSKCGRVQQVEGCCLSEMWGRVADKIKSQSEFTLTGHVMQYIGICPTCASKQA